MIEIVTTHVEMPELDKRRFKRNPVQPNINTKWIVTDTEHNKTVYKGKFEEASLICHNLNKRFYRDTNYGKSKVS